MSQWHSFQLAALSQKSMLMKLIKMKFILKNILILKKILEALPVSNPVKIIAGAGVLNFGNTFDKKLNKSPSDEIA